MIDLDKLIKAYDIRGTVPDQFNEDLARQIGAAYARLVNDTVIVVRDMRASSVPLAAAFIEGVTSQGQNVIDAGLGSTDLLYFASGVLDLPGAMFTASHNPAQYNGIKLCRRGAKPVGQDTGLAEIRERAQAIVDGTAEAAPGGTGTVERRDLLGDYAAHLRRLVDLREIRPLTVVVDAGNGMGGYTVPAVLGEGLPLRIIPLYFELDGTFPNHEANPLEPANLIDLQKAVQEHRADLGLAFDGDADRCF